MESPLKRFNSSVTVVEYGPIVQPSDFRVDIQSPLSCDTDSFRRDDDKGKDKALQTAFHVYAGKDAADFEQQVLVEILHHGCKEQEHRIVLHG